MSDLDMLVTVVRADMPAVGVRRLRLARPGGEDVPRWEPGAHIELRLPNGLVRQYSLCGDPSERDHLEFAVLLEAESRGGSAYLHNELLPGAELYVSDVRTHFDFEDHAPEVVLIAGGIGITPLLPMIEALNERGARWTLHYAGKSRSRMAFLDELRERHGDQVQVYVSEEGDRLDLRGAAAAAGPEAMFYACGPDRLLTDVEAVLQPLAGNRLRVERFRPRGLPADVIEEAFTVELVDSGIEVLVPPHRSILDVVRDAGVDVPSSCEEGTCGTCETPVLDGEPDHRDSVLSELERTMGETMMICVSRACGKRLTLEL